jgi:hypothetical protein
LANREPGEGHLSPQPARKDQIARTDDRAETCSRSEISIGVGRFVDSSCRHGEQ